MKMKIKLQGIGIIKNSEIELDGLTVITGDNNSGKTTVGKVVYSLFDAVSDLQNNFEADKNEYASKTLRGIIIEISFLSVCFNANTDADLAKLFSSFSNNIPNAAIMAKKLYEWLKEFYEIGFDAIDSDIRNQLYDTIKSRFSKNKIDFSFEEYIGVFCETALDSLSQLINNLEVDALLFNYAKERIEETLKIEFSEQIQPIKVDVKRSSIILENSENTQFRFDIVDNKLSVDNNPAFLSPSIKNVYFVDNPFILDFESQKSIRDYDNWNDATILNVGRISHHENKLRRILKKRNLNIYESSIIKKQYKEINEKINGVISGDFEFSHEGNYYISKGRKLRFSNLATGSKLFAILKLLINRGALNDSTILILDEPEAHLHPAWQNKFAEIIVMLVKELNVKVLLTSHSPNFVLAIDAFMRKYNINDKTNFYQTHRMEDDFAEYKNVNDDMGKIYADFVQYLTEVKLLRNKYMHGLGENND